MAAIGSGHGRPAEFIPIGVFDRAADEGPAMVAINAPPTRREPPARDRLEGLPQLDERPGVIEVDLPAVPVSGSMRSSTERALVGCFGR